MHPADGEGRYRIHFGAKRLRAAIRVGLREVPVVVRDLPADRYAQVAENQKRHGLTPLELARFIRAQVDAGDSNATIARQLGMNLTTVAHPLALLDLPPELDEAMKSGRCTSPRTLYELSKLHADNPEQVQSLLDSGAEITRTAVSDLRADPDAGAASEDAPSPSNKLIAHANAACDRLERALGRIQPSNSYKVALPELIALRIRVEGITKRWLHGSDRQTPSQTLATRAHSADVSQGAYVAGLLDNAPPPPLPSDHRAAIGALLTSTDQLAALSADLNAFMRLLGRGNPAALEPYRASVMSLSRNVQVHMAAASRLMSELKPPRG